MCKRNFDWLPLSHLPPGDLAHNPGVCPDKELNCGSVGLWEGAQPTEPHQ